MEKRVLFESELKSAFNQFCQKNEVEQNTESLLEYLLDRNFIANNIQFRYLVVEEYNKSIGSGSGKKYEILNALASRFSVKESTIRNIVKNHSLDFIQSNRYV